MNRRTFLTGLLPLPLISPAWRFVVMGDWLNNDILYPQPGWEETLATILNAIKAESPDFLIIPGDLVMGRWSSVEEIEASAAAFYPAWKARIEATGLPYYVCIGDHEIGDLPYYNPIRAQFFDLFKAQFRQYLPLPWNSTDCSYSFTYKGILFAVLDLFLPGGVVDIAPAQLDWLDTVLSQPAEHKFVIGHTPVLWPVPWLNSSRLHPPEDSAGRLWELFRQRGVSAYFCGEVHTPSHQYADGCHQIVTGSLIGWNDFASYTVVSVGVNSIEVEIKRVPLAYSGGYLPQAGEENAPREAVSLAGTWGTVDRFTVFQEIFLPVVWG